MGVGGAAGLAVPKQHFLNFLPLPHGHGSFLPVFIIWMIAESCCRCVPLADARWRCVPRVVYATGLSARPSRLRFAEHLRMATWVGLGRREGRPSGGRLHRLEVWIPAFAGMSGWGGSPA